MDLYMQLVLCVDEEFYDVFVFTWSLIRKVYDIFCIEICNYFWIYWNANKYDLNVSTNTLCLCGY